MKSPLKEGLAIITLKEKYRKIKKTGEIYYLLKSKASFSI